MQGIVPLEFADLGSHERRLARLARWQAATTRQHRVGSGSSRLARVHPEICRVTSSFVVRGGLGQDLRYYSSIFVGNLPKSIVKAACERRDISYHDMAEVGTDEWLSANTEQQDGMASKAEKSNVATSQEFLLSFNPGNEVCVSVRNSH